MLQFKAHRLTAEMHVGVHRIENDVFANVLGARPWEGPMVGWDFDGVIDEDTGLQAVLDGPIGKVKP